ncbi:hypothetical protein C0991_005529 [Blastosporella zonata]|nr:hypothetical protein C0991_005529 [Blastosporella zonata]
MSTSLSATGSHSRSSSATASITMTSNSTSSASTTTSTGFSFTPFSDPFPSSSSTEVTSPSSNPDSQPALSKQEYMFLFVAIFVILVGLGFTVVVRPILVRRRYRRMFEEAIRDGTWPSPPDESGLFGLGNDKNKVDLKNKPKLYEAFVGQTQQYAQNTGKVETTTEYDWDSIRPFSVTYALPPAEEPATSKFTTPMAQPPLAGRMRGIFRRTNSPTWSPAELPTVTTPVASPPLIDGTYQIPVPVELQKIRAAVLIAMPRVPESTAVPPLHTDQGTKFPHLVVGVADLDLSLPPTI